MAGGSAEPNSQRGRPSAASYTVTRAGRAGGCPTPGPSLRRTDPRALTGLWTRTLMVALFSVNWRVRSLAQPQKPPGDEKKRVVGPRGDSSERHAAWEGADPGASPGLHSAASTQGHQGPPRAPRVRPRTRHADTRPAWLFILGAERQWTGEKPWDSDRVGVGGGRDWVDREGQVYMPGLGAWPRTCPGRVRDGRGVNQSTLGFGPRPAAGLDLLSGGTAVASPSVAASEDGRGRRA